MSMLLGSHVADSAESRIKTAIRSLVAIVFAVDDNSHSQTTKTRQPKARSSSTARMSRATLCWNFSSQNGVLLLGTVAILHPG